MGRCIMHVWGLVVALVFLAGPAQAVSLGKVDVASHLGEPFYAEVPLELDEGEVISSVFVELGAPADYRILEVYRDNALNLIRADVKSDSRGQRVELTSTSVIEAPFFNLILKVRYDRATHFKKYPVFLDLPRAAKPSAAAKVPETVDVTAGEMAEAVPVVTPVQPMAETPAAEKEVAGAESFKPYDGWARTGRYGPMVFGDTVTTVAQRLRVDDRFTNEQVMVALFEKNRDQFDEKNINLIKAGTYLDVPTAAEVERIRPQDARATLAAHEKTWRQLSQQPRYAAVEEAQRTRYSKRVRVGEQASGTAAAPMPEEKGAEMTPASGQDAAKGGVEAGSAAGVAGGSADAALETELMNLRKQNEELQARLKASEEKAAAAQAAGSPEAQAAMQAKLDRLEIQLQRMQAERDRAREEAASVGGGGMMEWIAYGLGGVVVLLLGAIAYLLRRERPHPAAAMEQQFDESGMMEPEVPEEPVEGVSVGQDATMQMSAEEFESSFGSETDFGTDSIPELTDEDTSEMEAFQEEVEEEPDPNVDYLSEADVYMRYGMEDEAEKQVQMALRLREDNKDAHIKLVQVRNARGDAEGAAAAAAAAREVLAGDALEAFEAAIASEAPAGAGSTSLEDTLSPETAPSGEADTGELDMSGLDFGGLSEEEAPAAEAGEEAAGELDMSGLDFGGLSEEEAPAAEAGEEAAGELDMGGLDFGGLSEEEAPAAEEAANELDMSELEPGELDFSMNDLEGEVDAGAKAEPAAEEESSGGLDFDLSDLGSEESAEPEASEAAAGADEETVAITSDASAEGLDFDLGELEEHVEEPAPEAPAESSVGDLDIGDMDKTVVMDWSSETVTDEESAGSESGAQAATGDEGLSFDLSGGAEEESAESIDFDLGGLDTDIDSEPSEFTSSVQTTFEKLTAGSEDAGDDVAAADDEPMVDLSESEGDIDIDLSLLSDGVDSEPSEFTSSVQSTFDKLTAGADDSSSDTGAAGDDSILDDLSDVDDLGAALGVDSSAEDFNATLELDSLLSELDSMGNDSGSEAKEDADKPDDEDDNPFKI